MGAFPTLLADREIDAGTDRPDPRRGGEGLRVPTRIPATRAQLRAAVKTMAENHIANKQHLNSRVIPSPPAAGTSEDLIETELKARSTQQALLVEVNATLAAAIDAELVLPQILSQLTERTRLINASIYLLDREKRQLRCAAQSGLPTVEPYRTLALDGPGLVAWVARTGEAVYVPDVSKDARYLCAEPRAKSEYSLPLRAGPTLVGVLNIESDVDGIRAVTRKLVDQFASQAALAIDRSDLYKRLQASEERFRSIFEQGHIGVALVDLHGRFVTVNPALAQMVDYAPPDLRGLHLTDIVVPEERQHTLDLVNQLLEGKAERFTIEGRCLRQSGETLWCIMIGSPIRDSAGHPAYTLAMLLDISERKKAENERARLQEQLFHAQKMKALGTLAGGIAHDFNNLLGVIQGYASLLRLRLPRDDPSHEPVRMIEQSAKRAADLTRQLLQFARQETYRAEDVNIGEVVGQVLKIVTETFDRRMRIETRLATELPRIIGDPGQLELALLNLCINARDAMPEGGTLTVGTSVVTLGSPDASYPAQCSPGEYVRVAIKDTGVGIEPAVLERIFDPFFTTKESGKGCGLGLATVYGVVSNHGGFVRAASQVGGGSEFTLYLPVSARSAELPVEAPLAQAPHGSGTVLVVDDEPFMLTFAEEALKELGYNVLTAADGRHACEIYARQAAEIDCVLLDLVMPDMSGMETQEALRTINPRVRVILISGYSGGGEAARALESGAVSFLAKPCTIETLAQALKTVQVVNGTDTDRPP